MSTPAPGEGLSKSAKRRAAAKRNKEEADAAEAAAAAPPAPEPKAKAKSKAEAKAEPKAKAKAEPKAQAKAEAKAEPKAKADPKAKGQPKAAEPKGKAKAEPKKAEPVAPAPEPEPAPKSKAKAKKQAKPQEEKQPVRRIDELPTNAFEDDGTGGDWSVNNTKKPKKEKSKESGDGKAATGSKPAQAPILQKPKANMSREEQKAAHTEEVRARAKAEVERIMSMTVAPEKKDDDVAVEDAHTASVKVPEARIGVIIGPRGETLKMIEKTTGVKIDNNSGGLFTVIGPKEGVDSAKVAIQEIADKGYCTLQYTDFAEGSVQVHPNYFPDIIGSKGAIIQEIKKKLKVEVTIPKLPEEKERKQSQKFKVSLAGEAKQVEEAKDVINSIMMYGHHEVTHPGMVHEEMEIDKDSFKYIIGRQGSEMKHIQNNFAVKVNIPREYSVNPKVVVVGDKDSVDRAKAYIDKVIYQAENNAKSREKEGDANAWGGWGGGDDDKEERWAEAYMVK